MTLIVTNGAPMPPFKNVIIGWIDAKFRASIPSIVIGGALHQALCNQIKYYYFFRIQIKDLHMGM